MKTIETVIRRNTAYSNFFIEKKEYRHWYRRPDIHPTAIGVWMCMDGRCSPDVFGMVPGILEFWRNGGCLFDLGWLGFQPSFKDWYLHARMNGRQCLVVLVDHFSGSDPRKLGCAAHGCDDAAARMATWSQVEDLWSDFEEDDGTRNLYAIACGLDTDTHTLVFRRRKGGEVFDLATAWDLTERELTEALTEFYAGELPQDIVRDIVPWASGNILYGRNTGAAGRSPQGHRESVIAVGRGLDWFGMNEALVIGPFSPDFEEMVAVAAKIVMHNIESEAISPSRGAVLLAAAPFHPHEGKPGRRMAARKAEHLAKGVEKVIRSTVPGLVPYLHCAVGIVDNDTRRLRIERRNDLQTLV